MNKRLYYKTDRLDWIRASQEADNGYLPGVQVYEDEDLKNEWHYYIPVPKGDFIPVGIVKDFLGSLVETEAYDPEEPEEWPEMAALLKAIYNP